MLGTRIHRSSRLFGLSFGLMSLLLASIAFAPPVLGNHDGGHFSPQGWSGTITWSGVWDRTSLSNHTREVSNSSATFAIKGADQPISAAASYDLQGFNLDCPPSYVHDVGSVGDWNPTLNFYVAYDSQTDTYTFLSPVTMDFAVHHTGVDCGGNPADDYRQNHLPYGGAYLTDTLENGALDGSIDLGEGVGVFTWHLELAQCDGHVVVVSAGQVVGGRNPTEADSNGCWDWLRAPTSVKVGGYPKNVTCHKGTFDGRTFWTFDEARGTETAKTDNKRIAGCVKASMAPSGYVFAAPNLWAAYSENPLTALADRMAATAAHTNSAAIDAVFLEAYFGQNPNDGSWLAEWNDSWLPLGYSVMIDVGSGPEGNAQTEQDVYDICIASKAAGVPLGVWAGTGSTVLQDATRFEAIVNALNRCTAPA